MPRMPPISTLNLYLLTVLLLFCGMTTLVQPQETSLPTPSCVYNYTLRVDITQTSSSDSMASADSSQCVRSSQDGFGSCQTFSAFLGSFNGNLGPTDCLRVFLEPGEYHITTETGVVMTYSIIISDTSSGGVKLTCLDSLSHSQPSSLTDDPNIGYSVPLTFNKHVNGSGEAFVFLEGISFEDCIRPLQFDELDSVSIVNCSFRDFSASAIDLFNVYDINIKDCLFNNCSTDIGKDQFRANSGAVSIAYHSLDAEASSGDRTDIAEPVGIISNCNFTNNRVILPPGQSRTQINQAVNQNIYYGRGGAVGIFVQESLRNVSFIVEDCLFDRNLAESFGGGLYLYLDGVNTHHNFTVKNNNFTRNVAGKGSFGGGLQLALLIQNLNTEPSRLDVIGCHFQQNVADYGGGLSTVQGYSRGAGNLVAVSECTFIGNNASKVGSAVMFSSFLYVQNRHESYQYKATNNTFSANRSPGGTVGVGYINVNFFGYNILQFNNGPGLRIVGSQVEIQYESSLSLIGNNAENQEGGALYIQDFGQIKVYPRSSLEFVNNTGRIGSAIVVNVQQSSPVFSQLIFNPQCFLVHNNSQLAPGEWDDVSIIFSGNRASVGPAVYISHLDHCSWYSAIRGSNLTNEINATFRIDEFPTWAVFKYTENSNVALSQKDNPKDKRFYFQTEPIDIISHNKVFPLPVRPGEQRPLNLQGLDQFGNPTYIIVRLSDSRSAINPGAFSQAGTAAIDNSTDPDIVRFEPALLPIQPSDESVIISYGFPALRPDQFHDNEVIRIILDTPYNIKLSKPFFLNMSFVHCQPGFELRNKVDGDKLVSCLCVRDNFDILNCEEDVIILRDGHWAGEEDEPFPHLDLTPCPASYCQCHFRGDQTCQTLFFQGDPTSDLQCHPLRNGTLCGHCINGTGVGVLRTNCRECTKDNYFALGFLVVGDAILVGLILFLAVKYHMIFPHSLKGFLFYIQTAYYTTEYFPVSFWDIRQYMLYISSSLGLYFPWDFCLFPSMTALVSVAPKFTPAAIATTISVIAVICIHVTRSRNGREYIWHGVWTLVLLLYAPLVHTCVTILHCPYIASAAGREETNHWYLDGEVKCFQDPGHIVLGLVALLVLFLLILLIPAVFIFTVMASFKKIQDKSRTIGWLYNALTAGYRDSWEAKWWASFELLRRLLLIVIAVSLPGRSVANLYVILNILAMHIFFKPYAKIWQNVIETVILISFTLLMLIRATPTFLDNISTYTGTEVPDNRGTDLAAMDDVTWLLFPFFYFPVGFGIIYCIIAIIHYILRKIQDQKIRRSFELQAKAYRASEVTSVFGNVNLDEDDYQQYEDEDIRSRTPDYTKTDIVLDELMNNND